MLLDVVWKRGCLGGENGWSRSRQDEERDRVKDEGLEEMLQSPAGEKGCSVRLHLLAISTRGGGVMPAVPALI